MADEATAKDILARGKLLMRAAIRTYELLRNDLAPTVAGLDEGRNDTRVRVQCDGMILKQFRGAPCQHLDITHRNVLLAEDDSGPLFTLRAQSSAGAPVLRLKLVCTHETRGYEYVCDNGRSGSLKLDVKSGFFTYENSYTNIRKIVAKNTRIKEVHATAGTLTIVDNTDHTLAEFIGGGVRNVYQIPADQAIF